jgi:F0F1-type ATP synthase assembly protein I
MYSNAMTDEDPKSTQESRRLVRQISTYATLGLEMGLSIGVCVLLGRYLDVKFDAAPGFLLGGLGLGLLAAGRAFYRAAKRASKES